MQNFIDTAPIEDTLLHTDRLDEGSTGRRDQHKARGAFCRPRAVNTHATKYVGTMRIDEKLIKVNVLNALRSSGAFSGGAVIASEVALGSIRRRIDLLVVADRIIGIEIKGPLDSLARLPGQVAAYRQCFEQLIVVVHHSHHSAAMHRVPNDCDLWIVDDSAALHPVRENNVRLFPSRSAMLSVMGGRASKIISRNAPANSISYAHILESYRSFIVKKFEKTSTDFMSAIEKRSISDQDLSRMSRFAHSRKFALARESARASRRADWCATAAKVFGPSQSAQASSSPPVGSP